MTSVLSQALLHGWGLDGRGGGTALDAAAVAPALREAGAVVWLHLDRAVPGLAGWLVDAAGLPEAAVKALLAEDTRPRFDLWGDGALINLRGVNLNPGAAPEDMLSVRVWASARLALSFRRFPIMAVRDIDARLREGAGPTGTGQFLALLADGLTERMAPFLGALDDEMEILEDRLEDDPEGGDFASLRPIRRRTGMVRRFLGPQQSAVARLAAGTLPWLSEADHVALRQTADDVTRMLEDLDSLRDRATLLMDALAQAQAERSNRTMYLLTIVAGIFLPLGFLTGLLGINVGGMPGVDSPAAFWIVCAVLAVIVAAEVWILRRKGWI